MYQGRNPNDRRRDFGRPEDDYQRGPYFRQPPPNNRGGPSPYYRGPYAGEADERLGATGRTPITPPELRGRYPGEGRVQPSGKSSWAARNSGYALGNRAPGQEPVYTEGEDVRPVEMFTTTPTEPGERWYEEQESYYKKAGLPLPSREEMKRMLWGKPGDARIKTIESQSRRQIHNQGLQEEKAKMLQEAGEQRQQVYAEKQIERQEERAAAKMAEKTRKAFLDFIEALVADGVPAEAAKAEAYKVFGIKKKKQSPRGQASSFLGAIG